jgi:hypothetical protein
MAQKIIVAEMEAGPTSKEADPRKFETAVPFTNGVHGEYIIGTQGTGVRLLMFQIAGSGESELYDD